MKKTFTLILSFLFLLNIYAQDIKYGIKGGFISSCIANEDNWSKPGAGFNVGLFASYYLSEELGVSFEPAFSRFRTNNIQILDLFSKSSPKLSTSYLGDDGIIYTNEIAYDHHNLSFTTLDLPVLVNFKMNMGGMGIRFFAGPSLDFILKSKIISYRKEVVTGDQLHYEIASEEDITDRFEYYDFSGVAGIGVDLELEPVDLNIDLSYKQGFKNINNVAEKSPLHLRSINLSVGIGLNKLF
jgi:hypothetical protein